MKRCIVSGSSGFIGSRLCIELERLGCEIVRLDRPSIDLAVDPIPDLSGCDVYHFAAATGLVRTEGEYRDGNVIATQRMLAASAGAMKFVFASTSSVYGECAGLDEDAACRPLSIYGRTKLEAEDLVRRADVPWTILRYFSVYGPGQRPDMCYRRFIDAALGGTRFIVHGDGSQTRTNTYIDDAISAAVHAPVGTYNIGGTEIATLFDALRIIAATVGRFPETTFSATLDGCQCVSTADVRRASKFWSPIVPLDEGLRRQISWQKERA